MQEYADAHYWVYLWLIGVVFLQDQSSLLNPEDYVSGTAGILEYFLQSLMFQGDFENKNLQTVVVPLGEQVAFL